MIWFTIDLFICTWLHTVADRFRSLLDCWMTGRISSLSCRVLHTAGVSAGEFASRPNLTWCMVKGPGFLAHPTVLTACYTHGHTHAKEYCILYCQPYCILYCQQYCILYCQAVLYHILPSILYTILPHSTVSYTAKLYCMVYCQAVLYPILPTLWTILHHCC